MINVEKYKKILDSGLLLDHYNLLCSINEGLEVPKSKRITGFLNLLNKKGYIEDDKLTDLALLLIEPWDSNTTTHTTTIQPEGKEVDFAKWVKELHTKIQDKLVEYTGNKQIRDKIGSVSYSFLPNPTDLGKVLSKVIVLYKLKDLDAIERCIFKFIDRKNKENKWFPILGYYITKDHKSQLVTDLENMDDGDEEEGYKSIQKHV